MASSAFLIICSLLLSSICCFAASNNGGFTVDLIHRDSQKSPSYDNSTTRFQRIRSAFDRSFSRKSSFMTTLLRDSIEAPITSAGGEFVMEIKLGTPPVSQVVIADTGSDLLWTQCKPCTQCYSQNLPLFNPSASSSYRAISCSSSQCAAAGRPSCDESNSCLYQVAYGDRSHSSGDVAVETLTFDGGVSFPKVAFGCGHDNQGTFSNAGTGIIGLGGGSISIIKQLQSTIGGKFSYCLTSLNSKASSKISFGSNAVVAGPSAVSTPLVRKAPATFYYLTLEGISVGTERMEFRADYAYDYEVSGGAAVEEGNIIIDSGTTLTLVPSEMYEGVEAALVKVIDGTRVSDPQGSFGLCYRLEGEGFKVPTVTAHFKGADLVLPEMSVFVEVEEGIACLTLVPSQDLAIFGNLHQINYHVGYDLVEQQVSFMPTDCSAGAN